MKSLGRLTPATADVLEVLLDSGDAVWGLRIVKTTGRPAGSVYPILERLEGLGWTTSQWEDAPDRAGPRRRLYVLKEGARASAVAVVEEVWQRRQAKMAGPVRAAQS